MKIDLSVVRIVIIDRFKCASVVVCASFSLSLSFCHSLVRLEQMSNNHSNNSIQCDSNSVRKQSAILAQQMWKYDIWLIEHCTRDLAYTIAFTSARAPAPLTLSLCFALRLIIKLLKSHSKCIYLHNSSDLRGDPFHLFTCLTVYARSALISLETYYDDSFSVRTDCMRSTFWIISFYFIIFFLIAQAWF